MSSFADVFTAREAAEGLQAAREAVGVHDVGEMRAPPIMALVKEAFNCRALNCSVPLPGRRLRRNLPRRGRSTWPLVQGWLGVVSRCPTPLASQILSKRIGLE